ncbi:MAG: penicillin-binding protein 2, partial [Chloroflexi bacterium]
VMTPPAKISRRIFLKGAGLALLLTGCSPRFSPLDVVFPTATPLPTPTPTPLPSADGVVQAYLQAWTEGDYSTMYSLLTPTSRQTISAAQFEAQYRDALNAATVTRVDAQLISLLHTGDRASALFFVGWQTRLFGPINADNEMKLEFQQGRWGVVWQPTLVLPQLGHGVSLALLGQPPARGNIYDRRAHALATLGQMVTVGVVPMRLEDRETTVQSLAQITGVKPERINAAIDAARPDWFVPIADIDFETSLKLDNLFNNLPGVDRRAREVRAYPDGELAAHIIGYMGAIPAEQKQSYLERGYQGNELVGLDGVERWAEAELAGQRGGRLVTLSPSRQVLAEIASTPARAGSSVFLTIDAEFQARVEALLGERLGAVVVMDPHTGAIYAMASYPRFQPVVLSTGFDAEAWLKLYTNDQRPLVNRATQGLYPPGSIFKIVTLSAALEELAMPPETTYICTGKWYGLGEAFVKDCWLKTGHGQINLIDGLTQSCDVVFYELGLALHRQDPDLLPRWARLFGLGASTGIIGLNDSPGIVPDNRWKQAALKEPLFDGDAVNSAIGQGYMLATPLQVACLLAAIANGGKLLRPYIIDRIVDVDGNTRQTSTEVQGTLPLKPENMALIRQSLEAVTSGARGTARQAFEGAAFTVAGKTGTAESGQEKPHAWFAGYTPADRPEAVIAVILEHAGEGSKEAAPLFRQVAEAFFEWKNKQENNN